MKTSIALITLTFILFSCSTDNLKPKKIIKIDIEDKSGINLPKISIESVIPLVTNDSSIFGNIASIEYCSNRIYLLDIFVTKSLIVFSEDGGYISRTNVGRGPEEMINPFAFFVDKNNETVLVWDQTINTMFKYDLDLNFLSKNKYTRPIQNFSIINKNEILVQSHFYKDFNYKLYTSNFDTIIGQYIRDYPYSGTYGLLRPISINKRVLLIAPLDYNVYQLTDLGIHSEYYFDFGKYQLKRKELENNSLTNNLELINSGQRVSSLYEIAESENFLLFHVYFNKREIYYAYSFIKGKPLRLNDYFDNGILPVCKIRGTIGKDRFYALVEPLEMIKFQKSTGREFTRGEININQNPFLLTFSISSESSIP